MAILATLVAILVQVRRPLEIPEAVSVEGWSFGSSKQHPWPIAVEGWSRIMTGDPVPIPIKTDKPIQVNSEPE